MKAWVAKPTGYPQALTQVELPNPTSPPTPNHILVRVHAAALNPVDIQIMNVPIWPLLDYLPSTYRPTANKGVGCDFSGQIIAAGNNAKDFKAGDRVHGFVVTLPGMGNSSGLLQETAWVDITKSCVAKLPSSLSYEAGAAIPLVWLTARTCIDAVERQVRAAEEKLGRKGKVVVLGGSSSTGQYVVRQAVARGWQVLSTCSGRNSDFVKSDLGAARVVDYTKDSVYDAVKDFQPDAIVDTVGGTDLLSLTSRYVTIVGDKTERAALGGSMTYLYNPQMYARWLLGSLGLGVQYDCVNLLPRRDWLEETHTLLSNGKIVIDSEYDFDQTLAAFERLASSRARGKVVIKI